MLNIEQELKEWMNNSNTELANWAQDVNDLKEQHANGELADDEYKELLEDIKRSEKISKAADDLAVRSRANDVLDNLITGIGAVL
jgi:hypothetical protein|tara:strand:- start:452 stop:706 length:255 start_codon:yes stop_codon:yes gene_type:complete